jgi:PAS domain S-box-containing protein
MTSAQEFTAQRDMMSGHRQAADDKANLQKQDAFPDQPPELALLYDTAPIGLTFLTPDCRYLKINQRLTEICGISVADHIGRSVRETVPQVADQVEFIVRTILHTGEAITGIEVHGQRIDKSNAERCWLTHWHPLRRRDGSILGINVVAEEITERKRSQEALAAAEQRYRALVRATSSLVWTTPADGQIVDMPEWRAYTGQSVEQVKGRGWLDALHPDDRERTAVVWQKAVDSRSLYETEYRIRGADGVYVWHQVRGVAITESHGAVREWVGICLDIHLRSREGASQSERDFGAARGGRGAGARTHLECLSGHARGD